MTMATTAYKIQDNNENKTVNLIIEIKLILKPN